MNTSVPQKKHDLVNLIQANISSLQQATIIIKQLPAEKYNHIASPYFESCFGKHIRHILDHYLCFMRDVDSGMIDYDNRARNARVEVDKEYALSVIDNICSFFNRLISLCTEDKTVSIQLCHDVGQPDGHITISSLGRELQFLQGHTVHHYALVATMLRFYNITIDESFGVAPSTLIHEKTIKETA